MRIVKSIIAVAFAACSAVQAAAGPANRVKGGLEFVPQGLKVRVEFYSQEIVRGYKEPASEPFDKVSIPVIMKSADVALTYGAVASRLQWPAARWA